MSSDHSSHDCGVGHGFAILKKMTKPCCSAMFYLLLSGAAWVASARGEACIAPPNPRTISTPRVPSTSYNVRHLDAIPGYSAPILLHGSLEVLSITFKFCTLVVKEFLIQKMFGFASKLFLIHNI